MSKRIGFALSFVLAFSLLSIAPSSADEKIKPQKVNKSIKGERCKPTDAIGHAPTDVVIPERVLTPREMARTMKQIVLDTNCGAIVIQPNYRARVALTAMNALIRGGFYDMSLCHRLTTEKLYVLQCGDPTATGRGGPNFTYGVENLPELVDGNYPDTTLPPSYTIVGRVIRGIDIVKMIAKDGTKNGSGDGAPKQVIAIERAWIR